MIHGRNVIAVLAVLLLPVAAAAASAGKVVIAQGVDPTTLDIMNQQESPASIIAAHIFETLWERDPNLKIIPALATEMPKLVAPTTWEVKLRKGVKFHNGEDFNAESAKFSIERVKDPKLRASSNFRPTESVEVVDPSTIRVHTAKPWPTFLTVMTFAQVAMYPPKAYAGKQPADISRQPIGTGIRLGRVHRHLREGHDREEGRPRLGGVHADRVRVHDLDRLDGAEVRRRAQLGILDTLDAELRRLGVEVLAVVELDALAELDLPRGRRHQLRHLGGEGGDDLEVRIALPERFEDVRGDDRRRRLLLVHDVERRRIDALRDHDLARRRRRRRDGQQQHGENRDDVTPMDHLRPSSGEG